MSLISRVDAAAASAHGALALAQALKTATESIRRNLGLAESGFRIEGDETGRRLVEPAVKMAEETVREVERLAQRLGDLNATIDGAAQATLGTLVRDRR